MASLYISAAHKSSGKTTVMLGLCRALSHRGRTVQAFKKGLIPYIPADRSSHSHEGE